MPQSNDTAVRKPRLVGMNHVALEVGDIEEALAFYGRIFQFTLRGKGRNNAFIDMGDQFINLTQASAEHRDSPRHFGLVVDDRGRGARSGRGCRRANCSMARSWISWTPGATGSRSWPTATSSSPRRRMCCAAWDLRRKIMQKTEKAHRELADKGMAPEPA